MRNGRGLCVTNDEWSDFLGVRHLALVSLLRILEFLVCVPGSYFLLPLCAVPKNSCLIGISVDYGRSLATNHWRVPMFLNQVWGHYALTPALLSREDGLIVPGALVPRLLSQILVLLHLVVFLEFLGGERKRPSLWGSTVWCLLNHHCPYWTHAILEKMSVLWRVYPVDGFIFGHRTNFMNGHWI